MPLNQYTTISNNNRIDPLPSPPPCPTIITIGSNKLLKIKKIDVIIEAHVSTAFIKLNLIFYNDDKNAINGKFLLNTENGKCIVSNCDIILSNGKTFTTSVIDPELITFKPDQNLQSISKDNGKGDYNPSVFEMPFHSCPGKSDIIITVLYIRDMDFISGNYQLLVPMTIPDYFLNDDIKNIVSINTTLYPGTVGCKWGSGSHPVIRKPNDNVNCIEFYYEPKKDVVNSDFSFYYHAWANEIIGSCIVQNGKDDESDGAFVLFLSPSANNDKILSRRIVFLLDHSGSMFGDPILQARESLITALHDLQQDDEFAICAFDDGEIWFDGEKGDKGQPTVPKLLPSSQVKSAIDWVSTISADGGTDILTSYKKSIKMLSGVSNKNHKLNMVVLITDGCVNNELEICKYAEDYSKNLNKGNIDVAHQDMVRTFTFGIGPFCNTGFLRSLAQSGHGYSHTAISIDDLKSQMVQFINKTNGPQLSGISMVLNLGKHCKEMDICPRQIPDLTSSSPLIVVGTFKGIFPSEIIIHGNNSNSEQVTVNVTCFSNTTIPVRNLVARQKIDSLVGKWWLAGNDSTKKKYYRSEAVALAIATSIPCVFTHSIAYESTSTPSAPATAHQNVAASSQLLIARNKGPTMKKGTAIILGTAAGAAIIFGSVAATSGNISIKDVADFINNSSGGFSPDMFNNFNVSPPNLDGIFGNVDFSSFTDMFKNIPTPNFDNLPNFGDNLPSVDSSCCCCFNCDTSSLQNANCIDLDAISSCSCINLNSCG